VTFYSNIDTINVWTDHEHINYSVGGIWNMYLCYFQNESYLESGMVRLYLLEDLLIYAMDTEIQQDKTSTVFTTKSSVFEDTEIQQDKASTGFTLYTEIIDFSGHRDPAG
jgi:hypothetical protein